MPGRVSDKSTTSATQAPGEPDLLLQYETAMKELEGIVQKMERGELKLEESLNLFERGMALTAQCRKALDLAELKVTTLMQKHGVVPDGRADQNDT